MAFDPDPKKTVQLGIMTPGQMMSHYNNESMRTVHAHAAMKFKSMAQHPSAGSRRQEFIMAAGHHAKEATRYNSNMRSNAFSVRPTEKMTGRSVMFAIGRSMPKAEEDTNKYN